MGPRARQRHPTPLKIERMRKGSVFMLAGYHNVREVCTPAVLDLDARDFVFGCRGVSGTGRLAIALQGEGRHESVEFEVVGGVFWGACECGGSFPEL